MSVSVEEAIHSLMKKYPGQRIISGMDMGAFYAFQMWGRSVNPQSILHMPATSALHAVRKTTGEHFLYHAFLSKGGEYKGPIDVAKFLDREDAAFVKKIRAMLEDSGGD